jgi:hypothetical protein
MPNIELIVLARMAHVMAGVIWAGATFVLATAIVAGRVGPIAGISALLTVLSGSYLFATLHKGHKLQSQHGDLAWAFSRTRWHSLPAARVASEPL